jgi:hypothetical protein
MIGLCKNCTHWSPREKGKGECTLVDQTDKMTIKIRVLDDSGLDYQLITASEFGCTLHKSK